MVRQTNEHRMQDVRLAAWPQQGSGSQGKQAARGKGQVLEGSPWTPLAQLVREVVRQQAPVGP